jgi:hypothetical protein
MSLSPPEDRRRLLPKPALRHAFLETGGFFAGRRHGFGWKPEEIALSFGP